MKRTAKNAPIVPPINENTSDNFCVILFIVREFDDLAKTKRIKVPF
jgi:hypothetical protein